MPRNIRKIAVPVFCAVVWVIALLWVWGWPYRGRDSLSVTAQRQWMLAAVQELSQVPPPSLELKPSKSRPWESTWWGRPNYLVFSNGWAAYKIHTIHDNPKVGDIAVLRTSGGAFYYSSEHYCVGICEWMEPQPRVEEGCPAPSDSNDFLEHYGKWQHWKPFAPDNRLWCVINFADWSQRRSKKPLRVWISRGEGTNRVTLLERSYKVSGSCVSWSTHWRSNECLTVDFYDYGPDHWPGQESDSSSLRSNYLTSLTFRQDNRTGQFREEK